MIQLQLSQKNREIIFVLLLFVIPFLSPGLALLLGLIVALTMGNPFIQHNKVFTKILLQASVVGLGFGMNIEQAISAGKTGIIFTIFSIAITMGLGLLFGKLLKINKDTTLLVSGGTAICGGSAIAAISPVIKAEEKQISVALGTIFILNSAALFLFPFIGHQLNLSQSQFGMWCAIAIHDTSSVVGAASKYGPQALEIATTVKLARALWIIPVAFLSTFIFKNKNSKIKIPYFIGLFVLAMIANTYIPFVQQYNHYLTNIAKAGLTLTLFLIGCGLNRKTISSVGFKPLIQGVILWVIIATAALWAVTTLTN